jgi:uncharacterized RDD family membrane protein YckC
MTETSIAPLWPRFLAMVIDALLLLIPGALFHTGLPFLGPVILSFLYYPIFHASSARATPGKRAMGLQVTTVKGDALSFGMAFLRHIFASGSTCMAFLGHFVAVFTERKQAVHDLVADSVVVRGRNDEVSTVDAWVQAIRQLFARLS